MSSHLVKQTLLRFLMTVGIFNSAVYGEDIISCDTRSLFDLFSSELADYEKISQRLSEGASEGAAVDYYYSKNILKIVKAIYYGETGKTEVEYRFSTASSYASRITQYYYSAPIYFDRSDVTAIGQSTIVVCDGKLVRGIGDNAVADHFNHARSALAKILENSPRKSIQQ